MKLVIFDIDGTLARTSNVDGHCFIPALREHFDTSNFDTDWRNYPNVSNSGILETLSGRYFVRPASTEEANAFESAFMARLREQPKSDFQAIPGANEMLALLRRTPGISLAIAAGCWRASADLKLRRAGIDVADIPMTTATDAQARTEILRIAKQKAAADQPDETLYFGDAEWDVCATQELDWRMIGIGDRVDRLRACGVPDCFQDFREPDEILRVINDG